jgi:membrane protein implicated in regulation of membrane protease activity
MHIVAIAWMFVVVLMAVAEATSTQGTVLGAFFTLLLYGALPLSIVMYVLGTPGRKRARQRAEAAEQAAASAAVADGDGSGHAAGAGLAPERKEP